jgi:mRNA interferase ChpB
VKRGEIYLVSLDPAAGNEQQGTRPVLIVLSNEFNRLNRVPIIVPITSGGAYARNAGLAVSLIGAGTRTTGVALCNQVRALDVTARNGRRLEILPNALIAEILARLMTFFE